MGEDGVGGKGGDSLTEFLGVKVFVFFVVRGLREADGSLAVTVADERLALVVFVWRETRTENRVEPMTPHDRKEAGGWLSHGLQT